MMTLPNQRHLFDIPHEVAYFNCAFGGPQLNASSARLAAGVQGKSHPWERSAQDFFEDAETIRALASSIFGGDTDGYAIVPAASYGMSTAARVVEPRLQPGDSILLVADEFPSVVLPWERVARERGANLESVAYPEDGDWTRAILGRMHAGVKVVALSSCHWTNGAYIDLRRIGRACRELGSIFAIDATQTLGAMPLALDEVKPDFLVAAGYKWLLCPYGFSLLYIAEQWRGARPLEETWLARQNAEDFAGLTQVSATYMPGARRFDVGEKCTPTILPGAIAALEQIRSWGVENIAASLSAINTRIATQLAHLGFILPHESQRCPHLLGARLPANCSATPAAYLKERKIHISQRGNSLRFAPHLHVNDHDVARLTVALEESVR